MPKKIIEKKLNENIKISESLNVSVLRRVVIPPEFTNSDLQRNYFNPRFAKVLRGGDVEWVNQDSKGHHLKFYEVLDNKVRFLFDLGKIEPNKSKKRTFDFEHSRIDYLCDLHKNEFGTIIIYSKPESEMTNTEQFRFLSKIFDIKPPAILSHLGSR